MHTKQISVLMKHRIVTDCLKPIKYNSSSDKKRMAADSDKTKMERHQTSYS